MAKHFFNTCRILDRAGPGSPLANAFDHTLLRVIPQRDDTLAEFLARGGTREHVRCLRVPGDVVADVLPEFVRQLFRPVPSVCLHRPGGEIRFHLCGHHFLPQHMWGLRSWLSPVGPAHLQ
jgi:hypothetical protein